MKKFVLLCICIISMSCIQHLSAKDCQQCVIGSPGPTGPAGVNGVNGVNGIHGVNGLNGKNGTNGVDGTDGSPGIDFNNYMSRYSTSTATLDDGFESNTIPFDTLITGQTVIYNPGNNSFTLSTGTYTISIFFLSENPIWGIDSPDVLVLYDNTNENELFKIASGMSISFQYYVFNPTSIDVRLPSGTTAPVNLNLLSDYSALIEIHQIGDGPPP